MSPLGAVTTEDGALNSSLPAPTTPALPSRSRILPSGLNLRTCCPLGPRWSPSVTHTLPSRSTCSPCGNTSNSSPKLFTSLPEASNLRMGASFDPSQLNGTPSLICDSGMNPCALHRSITHTLCPSGSTSTPEVDPHMRPSGSLAQL